MLSIDFFTAFLIAGSLLAAAYVFIVAKYLIVWKNLPDWNLPAGYIPNTTVSIIVAARNEANNIAVCIEAIKSLNYPPALFEIVVVDDHSEDHTHETVSKFLPNTSNLKIVRLSESSSGFGKKKAIEMGISHSSGELIVTTDADCLPPPNWLLLLVSFYEKYQWQFIAAPVGFYLEQSAFDRFQSLDFLGMMGATGANLHLRWAYMCNGANLAYPKKAFIVTGGFDGIDHLASGDDMMLMQKIAARFPEKIGFLKNKNAMVLTKGKPDISSFFAQRLRWATKAAGHLSWKTTLTLAVTFFYCCLILFSLLSTPFLGYHGLLFFVFLLSIKSVADYFFLLEMATYFERRDLIKNYLVSQATHIIYILLVGLWSNVQKQYLWKGRRVK